MRRSNGLVVLCLLALLSAACSSSSAPLTSDAPGLQETEAFIEELILPAIQLIGWVNPFTLFGQTVAANGGGLPCDMINCDTGMIEICVDGAERTATFTACVFGGVEFNNDIVLTEEQADPFIGEASMTGFDITSNGTTFTLSGTADLLELSDTDASVDLAINVVAPIFGVLQGSLISSLSQGCLDQSTDDLTFEVPILAAIGLDGTLTYCPDEDMNTYEWPTGVRKLAIVRLSSDLLYTADFSDSGNNLATVDVSDATDATLLVVCDVALDPQGGGVADCALPEEES